MHQTILEGSSLLPLRNMVDVDGGGGSDSYTVNMSGTTTDPAGTDYVVNVHDTGPPQRFQLADHQRHGRDRQRLPAAPELRRSAAPLGTASFAPDYERVNYDTTINLLYVVGGTAADQWYVDDNSAITVLDGVAGNDTFQFGQLYGTGNRYASTTPDCRCRTPETSTVHQRLPLPGPAAHDTSGPSAQPRRQLHATTRAYAGTGNATMTVYSNKANLKLFGQGGNNTFIVQAFLIINTTQVATSNTQITTGNGNNHVEYNINAPVSIDGGTGFNTLVVIGTQADDTFLITKDGIMGAGLNVQYTNISKVEVDGLGGNDIFDVLSTDPGVVTILEGGAGSDTFNVGGDVTTPVIALNPNGTSGIINHGVSSADPNYNGIFAPGVSVSVAGPTAGQVIVTQTAGGTTVVQDGPTGTNQSSYSVALGVARPTDGTVWYMSIAAAPDPRADSAHCAPAASPCGTSIQLSADGSHWSSSLVLVFDSAAAAGSATDWARTQTVFVRAASTSVVAGDQIIEVMSSVLSTSPVTSGILGFAAIPISNVEVHVIDADLPGLIVSTPASGLDVIEGSPSAVACTSSVPADAVDCYTVVLTKAPAAGETVTVTLHSDDPRLVLPSPLTFDASNWNTPQPIHLTALRDGVVEGQRLSTVTTTVTSSMTTGGVYSNGVVDNPAVKLNVLDGDSGGVLMLQQPTGQTIVGPGRPGFYTLQLTSPPTAPVTITLLSDGKTIVSSADRALPRGQRQHHPPERGLRLHQLECPDHDPGGSEPERQPRCR